ncbi:MAG: hypothetical protein E6G94_11015 [Alphaproteobacteria bacterium]|nr:MAG: hypothetical protein E6G94_11015 [Alphaproteobacteria bacterium]
MLSQLERIQEFAEAALAASSLKDLDDMMARATKEFGADYYLMVHHADFRQRSHGLINVGNYPDVFVDISRLNGTLTVDPIMEACERTLTGFFWDDVGSIVPLTKRHLERVAKVAETGLADGFVVPAHVPGKHIGSCHFAVETGKHVPRENSAALQSIATFGFEAARRLCRERDGPIFPGLQLSDRQRECLIFSAQGKSDATTAQLLGLSPKTVNAYMEEAKRRYGVATRQQLLAMALYNSEITYLDILAEQKYGWRAAACN